MPTASFTRSRSAREGATEGSRTGGRDVREVGSAAIAGVRGGRSEGGAAEGPALPVGAGTALAVHRVRAAGDGAGAGRGASGPVSRLLPGTRHECARPSVVSIGGAAECGRRRDGGAFRGGGAAVGGARCGASGGGGV